MSRLSTILRFGASAILAAAFVVFGGGWLVHEYVSHHTGRRVGLTVIRGLTLLTHPPGQGTQSHPEKAKRMLTGFVQVGFTVGPDGHAHGIHVIRSEPKGQYEEAARELIAARRYKPSKAGHAETRVVHFQVPASTLEKNQGSGGGDGSSGGS